MLSVTSKFLEEGFKLNRKRTIVLMCSVHKISTKQVTNR